MFLLFLYLLVDPVQNVILLFTHRINTILLIIWNYVQNHILSQPAIVLFLSADT